MRRERPRFRFGRYRQAPQRKPPAGDVQGTVTPWMTTGPGIGSSSVSWETPAGVMTSIAFARVVGSTAQIGLVPPTAHTPKVYAPGVAVKARAWSELKPSWPVRTTAKDHPAPGVPNVACGSAIVTGPAVCEVAMNGAPSGVPEAPCRPGEATPCPPTTPLPALAGAIV